MFGKKRVILESLMTILISNPALDSVQKHGPNRRKATFNLRHLVLHFLPLQEASHTTHRHGIVQPDHILRLQTLLKAKLEQS